jgi:tocopherol cyclase
VCAIAGVCRGWAMITLAAEPGGLVRTEIAPAVRISAETLAVEAGTLLRADARSLDVDLGPGARLHARFAAAQEWPRRAWGPLGPAQALPLLGQYWAPWLLGARVTGTFNARSLDGAHVYAEKNWGAAFAGHWWWGQAEFAAFAGGRVHGVAPTAIAVWTPDGILTLAPPLARTVAQAGGGAWRIRARSARWRVELEGEAAGAPLELPVPIPGERRLELRSRHHLRGRLALHVRRGRRTWLRAESALAALEDGSSPARGS